MTMVRRVCFRRLTSFFELKTSNDSLEVLKVFFKDFQQDTKQDAKENAFPLILLLNIWEKIINNVCVGIKLVFLILRKIEYEALIVSLILPRILTQLLDTFSKKFNLSWKPTQTIWYTNYWLKSFFLVQLAPYWHLVVVAAARFRFLNLSLIRLHYIMIVLGFVFPFLEFSFTPP